MEPAIPAKEERLLAVATPMKEAEEESGSKGSVRMDFVDASFVFALPGRSVQNSVAQADSVPDHEVSSASVVNCDEPMAYLPAIRTVVSRKSFVCVEFWRSCQYASALRIQHPRTLQ